MSLHLRDVEVDGTRTDVCVVDGHVARVGRGRCGHPPGAHPTEVEGRGGALIPGLHDHHLHVLALTAAWSSVDCGPGLEALRGAPGSGWVRGVNAEASVDRHALDRLVPDRPVRVQHRSGGLWMLNSAALRLVAHVLDDTDDVERDEGGVPTGRLWRYDARLRPALPAVSPELGEVGRRLARLGLTGVTDATPDLDESAISLLGTLPQRLLLLGDPAGVGPRKLLLRDHDLPDYNALAATVEASHSKGRPLAVHCVTRESLLLTLAVLDDVGALPGDRIEHAAICPAETARWIAGLGVAVVTQPDFLRSRGSSYIRDLPAEDVGDLYPYAGLREHGVRVAASSDAPFGEVDPWRVIATAADRPIGSHENVPARTALDGYLSEPLDPGGPPRRVAPGAPADMILLDVPLATALRAPDRGVVRSTWIAGKAV
ncbi:amidohydrolase family protein [Nocardioides panacihumi]|uniref:Amidohydrolase family protein n=1 Tax=Nocardioides panacihumi TaxID=400774 RepID=A0ABN2RJK0_9ACTN